MKKRKQEDRRILKTQMALQQALFQLILEKGFDTLSIQEIADRANVGRSTFYAHFASKSELLLMGFAFWEKHLLEHMGTRTHAGGPLMERGFCFSPLLLEHIHGHGKLYRAMAGEQGGALLQSRLRQSLTTFLEQELGRYRSARNKGSFDVMIQFVVGAFLGIVGWWLDHSTHLSPKEIDGLFRKLAVPVVEAEVGRKL